MPIIPSLAALVIGVAVVGLTGGAWWNYGEVTPATLLYVTQDMTQPSLSPTEPAQPVVPIQPATNQVTVPTPPPTGSTQTASQPALTGSNQQMPPPPEHPIMPPPPDQQGSGQEGGQPKQPMLGRPPMPPPDQRSGGQGQPTNMQQGRHNQPPMPPQRGGNDQRNEMSPAQEQNFEEEQQQEPQIDPREIRQALRDITQMQRELKRFLSTLRRYKADTSEVDQLLEKINQYRTTISGSDMEAVGTAVHEFRDENFWETIQKIRAKVELPRQLEQMKKEINRLEKTTKSVIYQRIGVDIDKIVTYINDSRAKVSQMESLLSSGEFEEINDLMQQNQDMPMPGEIGEVLMRLKEIDSRIRRVRDADLKDKVQGLISEVVQLVNVGEYREARDLINQNMQQIQQLLSPSFNRRSNGNRMAPSSQ